MMAVANEISTESTRLSKLLTPHLKKLIYK